MGLNGYRLIKADNGPSIGVGSYPTDSTMEKSFDRLVDSMREFNKAIGKLSDAFRSIHIAYMNLEPSKKKYMICG